ncbi:MAG: hypothetical protein NT055_02425 [Nitrospirae bacterium]|nr:hypothetical protein [Nitrospirota bacterium]
MEVCEGFEDWLACSRCPHLCTKMCPIEGENVIEKMKRKIRLIKVDSEPERHI